MDEFIITIDDILKILKKAWAMLIVAAIIGGAAAGAYEFKTGAPSYQSTAKIYVVSSTNNVIEVSDLQIGTSLTADYMELILGEPFLERVIDNLKLDYDYKTLKKCIKVENPENTRILKIQVTSMDPVESADIANELSAISVEEIEDIMENVHPKVIQKATPSYEDLTPFSSLTVIIGMIVGIVLCFAIYFIWFIADDRIRTEDDIKKRLDMQILAVVSDSKEFNPNEKSKKKHKRKSK